MKPKTSTVFSRLAPLILLASSTAWAQVPAGDLAAHVTEQEVSDSLKAALPFLEDKVASTIKDGASAPVAFHGEAQLRSLFHHYYNLPDSSYLGLSRQGFILGGDEPVLKLGMIITPGRNTVMWAKMGLSASYQGVNQHYFLNPEDDGYSYSVQHHNENKKIGIFEDMSAGIAIRTKPASFMLKMGAMNWNEASPLSIWKSQPRMFAWEYLPYEIEQPIAEYYKYNIAKGEKVGRAAWNKKPFQGIDFAITDIPGDFNAYFLYGTGQPYDMFERNSIDMATDLGYAADEGGVVSTGIGDSYRKHLFYRLSKKFNSSLQLGFNNGYVFTSTDIVNAGFGYDYTFNSKFEVGLFNSLWSIGNDELQITDKESYEKVLAEADETAKTIGEGFVLDPKYFSLDARGTIAGKFEYMADIGFSMVDTTYISLDNASYGNGLSHNGSSFTDLRPTGEKGYNPGGIAPGAIYETRTTSPLKNADVAAYLNVTYKSKVDIGLDLLYAGKNFYSPYSFVAPIDGFYAAGSNLLGNGNFLGSEASPYTKNMFGTGLTVKPNLPWYGHMKVKYGFNRQLSAGRDVLFFPYRLNGASMWATFNQFYSKWGLGKVTETYDFNNHQGGYDGTDADNAQTFWKHPDSRVGDESYGTYIKKETDPAKIYSDRDILNPTSGGIRSNAYSVYEGFVPYADPQDIIFNHFAKSSLVRLERDLSEVWNDYTRTFDDRRGDIGAANGGKGVRIVEDGDTSYYSMNEGSNELTITDKNGSNSEVVSTKSETGFVPVSTKNSFNLAFDWALDISKYIGYKNDLFLSLYYEINGASKGFVPFSVSTDSEDVLMMSHYIRSEPAIALSKDFYILGLIGWERWISDKAWMMETDNSNNLIGFKKTKMETTDFALGLGFDWDIFERVGLHGRYKWYTHKDSSIPDMRYDAHAIAFELKAYF